MSKQEFVDNFRKLLATLDDNYIRANLSNALDRYELGLPLPLPKPPVIPKREGVCIHNVSLLVDCDKCIESYGTNRILQL